MCWICHCLGYIVNVYTYKPSLIPFCHVNSTIPTIVLHNEIYKKDIFIWWKCSGCCNLLYNQILDLSKTQITLNISQTVTSV